LKCQFLLSAFSGVVFSLRLYTQNFYHKSFSKLSLFYRQELQKLKSELKMKSLHLLDLKDHLSSQESNVRQLESQKEKLRVQNVKLHAKVETLKQTYEPGNYLYNIYTNCDSKLLKDRLSFGIGGCLVYWDRLSFGIGGYLVFWDRLSFCIGGYLVFWDRLSFCIGGYLGSCTLKSHMIKRMLRCLCFISFLQLVHKCFY